MTSCQNNQHGEETSSNGNSVSNSVDSTMSSMSDAVDKAQDKNEDKNVNDDISEFVTEVASSGMMEVQLGEKMAQNATNPEVKNFAKEMVKDHTKLNEELKALAAKKNITVPTGLADKHKDIIEDVMEKKGKEMDKEYIDKMVDAHQKDLDKFDEKAKDAKDADLKNWAEKSIPTLRMHLEMAQKLQDKMKDNKMSMK